MEYPENPDSVAKDMDKEEFFRVNSRDVVIKFLRSYYENNDTGLGKDELYGYLNNIGFMNEYELARGCTDTFGDLKTTSDEITKFQVSGVSMWQTATETDPDPFNDVDDQSEQHAHPGLSDDEYYGQLDRE